MAETVAGAVAGAGELEQREKKEHYEREGEVRKGKVEETTTKKGKAKTLPLCLL